MLLRAYFDDSGSDGQSPYYVLAGYIATIERWEQFADEWHVALADPPSIKYFKAREAFRLKDQFNGFTSDQRDAKVGALQKVLRSNALSGFVVAMEQESYDRHVKGKIPQSLDSPYFFCFLGLVELTARVITSVGLKGTIDFVFDEQGIEKRARPVFDAFKLWQWPSREVVGNLDWRSDLDELPLQASDLLAWRLRRRLSNEHPSYKQMNLDERPSAFIQLLDDADMISFMDATKREIARLTTG